MQIAPQPSQSTRCLQAVAQQLTRATPADQPLSVSRRERIVPARYCRRQIYLRHEGTDSERNRLTARAARYARVGANVGGVAARIAGARLFGISLDRGRNAMELAAAFGGLKGPIMKVAQLMATVPDALPPEYATELTKLQSQAPPMGWAFVKRRMRRSLALIGKRNLRVSSIIPPRRRRSGRFIARKRMTAASLPASCNMRTCSRRSKPI